jgi:hypothetical protein
MTALTLYLNQNPSGTASTADQMMENASTGGTLSNKNTNLTSGTTGWVTLYAQGNPTGQTGTGSQPALADNGWIDDAVSLVGNSFSSGTWSVSLGFETTATGTFVADFHFRFYQRSSGGTRTLIGEAIASAQTIISTSYTVLTPSISASASNTFVTGDKVGCDVTVNITTNATIGNLRMQASSSTTLGNASAKIVTPGYVSSVQVSKDVAFRGRIRQQVNKDVAFRGRIRQQVNKDIVFRGNVGLVARNDVAFRGRISQQISKDVVFRGRISQKSTKDVVFRGRLANTITKDIVFRGKISNSVTKDVVFRGRISQKSTKDVVFRGRISQKITKDIVFRGNISGPRLTSGGFTLFMNGTGSTYFDHYRVTEYPDPALSLSPITPRVGNTFALWNALIPTNTTLGMDASLDGVNWTDVTSSNGGNIPGIFSQPDPTVDTFAINTSANYTSTFRTGGSTAAWTYDTANSRVVATGGTNGIFIYNVISRADIDFFADLDQSDAGGLVWRFVDPNNYYWLDINDSLTSVSPNTITLYKVASNVQTQLGVTTSITYNVGPASNYYTVNFTRGTYRRFRVTMLGGVITCYVDGAQLFTYIDGSPLGAGKIGLYNNGGTVGSRYYQLWMVSVGDYVTGTPQFDIVTGTFVYTRQRLATTDPTVTPQVEDITTLATTPEIGIGGTIPSVTYNASFVNKNFDDLSKASGDYTWFIDQNKRFNFKANGTIPAPWILQSAPSGLVVTVDLEVNADLEMDVGNDLYRNRQILLGVQSPTSTQVASFVGDGNTTAFTLGYPLASAPSSIMLDGVSQTFGLKGTSGSQWYYAFNDPVLQQDSSQAILQASDSLVVTYVGLTAVTVVVDDTTEQANRKAIEGGSGIVENVEDHSSDNPPMLQAQAIAYAQGLINRYAIAGRTLIFGTSRNGLDIGQTLSIFLPEHGIWDGQFLITQIEIKLQKAVGDAQVWWYKVTCSELPRVASWAKLLASGLGLQ